MIDPYLEELRERLERSSPEIGRVSGQRVLCSSGERIVRPLSPEEMREAEARLAERQAEREREWQEWFASGKTGPMPEPDVISQPSPAPKPKKELPPVEEGYVSELGQKINQSGTPWDSEAAQGIADGLERQKSAIDERLTLTLAGGRRIDWNDFAQVSAVLGRHGIGQESAIENFGDTWKLPLRLRSIFERWFLSESLALGQALSTSASAGRISDPLLVSGLSPDHPFADLSTRCLGEHWLEAIGVSDPRSLLVLSWKQALPSLAAWLSDDRFLMNAIRSDRLYEPLAGLRGQGSLAPQPYAVMSWLHGCLQGPSVHQFLGKNFGFTGEPDLLEDQMRALNYESSLASVETGNGWSRFLSAKRAEFTTELEMDDYDVSFQKAWGGSKRGPEMRRFRQDQFSRHTENFLAEIRFRGVATMLLAVAEALPSQARIIGTLRDSILIEILNGKRAGAEVATLLAGVIRQSLLLAFPGLPVRLFSGIGHSWGEARGQSEHSRTASQR
jgi:hypothetical protein